MVSLAFADASVVVLALPAIYARFDTTIVQVSWVLTGYAIAVAVAGVAIAAGRRWLRSAPLTVVGLVLFAAGSTWCGAASSWPGLLTGRVAQGIGAAALLAGALDVLCGQVGRERGGRLWSGAATGGLAIGPALGGALTEAFDWRVIFLFQVPVALLAIVVLAGGAVRRGRQSVPSVEFADDAPDGTLGASAGRGRAIWANAGYVTLFAGLVAALFLGVLMLVEVWQLTPLRAAVVMTALPAGTLLAGRLTARAAPTARIVVGTAGLAGGLLALAMLPAANAAWAAVALFVCGAGSGTAMPVLAAVAMAATGGLVRAGAAIVSAKHAGLVLGLVVIAPILAGSLADGGQRAVVAGTGALLEARMPVQDKVRLALAVRDELADAPRGSVPDLTKVRGAVSGDAAAPIVDEVDDRLHAVLTRAFRPAFAVAGGLSLLTLVAAIALRRGRRGIRGQPAASPLAAVALASLMLLAAGTVDAEIASGARGYGRYAETKPCIAPADPYPGSGVDALVQRVAFGALYGAACELGVSPERFVLALAGQPGFAQTRWDLPTVERTVRAAIERVVDDARDRDDLPGWSVALLRAAVRGMPLNRLLEILGF
jgi:predicted MFS family arabinose efflux permease